MNRAVLWKKDGLVQIKNKNKIKVKGDGQECPSHILGLAARGRFEFVARNAEL